MFFRCALLALALSSHVLGAPVADSSSPTVQKPGLTLPANAKDRQDAVKKIFVDSYSAYKKFAFGHDNLSPMSKGFSDGRNGWGASIVDAMSTMKIMGLDDFFTEALDFARKIDFSKSQTSDTVSVFETSIRYLGGLLSAFELSGEQHHFLVDKAKEVADKMAYAWVGNNAIPYGHIDFSTNQPQVGPSNIAEAGTLALEWRTLSKYANDDKYTNLAEKALKHIAGLADPLPGLAPQGIDPTTGQFVGGYVSWGGGSDSYFEYLIKYPRLTNTNDALFVDEWGTAVDSSIKTLLKKSTVGDHWYLADYDASKQIRHVGSHLACFYGGNWIYGGSLLKNQTIIDIGLQLTDACWNTYDSTATHIGPEVFAYSSSDGDYTGGGPPSQEQKDFYAKHGFYITAADYILRPEVLESNFYAWRATGDTKYFDRAAATVDAFNKFLPANVAFAGINDVDDSNSAKIDDMESFWFAEVLKYLYLTFDDPEHISLDKYVFNTEAHPFKAPDAKSSYGSGKIKNAEPFHVQGGALPQISPNPYLPRPLKDIIKPELLLQN